jgi:CHAT domain-containing protein/tetratricopeptide (TPR) repeat protein
VEISGQSVRPLAAEPSALSSRALSRRPIKRGLIALAFSLLLLVLIPIHDTLADGAQLEYQHAWKLFVRGNLAKSQQESNLAYKQFRLLNPAWASKFKLLEAKSMLYRGMYSDALSVLADYPNTGPNDDTIEKLAIEAVALTRQQQLPLADQKLTMAENLCGAVQAVDCGEVLSARAILESRYGRLADARESFLKALWFARSHNDPWLEARSSLNLGFMALQVDHYDEAVDWSMSASRAAVASGFENTAQSAEGNLGWAYYQLGDDERALELFLAAEKTAEQLGNVRDQLKWLSNAGYVYRDSGDWSRAAWSYRQTLNLAQQTRSREDIVIALEDLAQISVYDGKLDDADAYIAQVAPMETAGGLRPTAVLILTMGELAAARRQYAQADAYFRSVRDDRASLMTTRLAAGYDLAKLFEAQNSIPAAEQMYKATLTTYEAARAQLKSEESQLPFGANAIQIYDSYIRLLLKQGRTEDALAAADLSRARGLEQNFNAPAAKTNQRPAALNPRGIAQATNSTLLFYWLGAGQSYLWVITPAKIELFPLPAERQIADRVEHYRHAVLDMRDPIDSGDADGQALYQMLVSPAAKLIRPNMPVIILADGILSQLNFETLLVPGPSPDSSANLRLNSGSPANLHFLLDDLTLSSAPSLSLLGAASPAADTGQSMLLLGNPISPNQDFPALPMFSFEMTRVESHFPPTQLSVYAGQQATPAAYLASRPIQYSYIHFVSHAVASRTNPLDSAIILSNSTTGEASYKLYARDIIQHPIGAKLVTISACYGSGTRAYAGEGLVGLSWAFLRAGAQRVIGALWEVSDDSTPLLMDSLYRGIANGDSPAVALRNAKLALLHSQSRFREPFYWAPFQLYIRR